MEETIKSLISWGKNRKGYPTQIQIHPTNYCNLKCIFCPTRALVKELDRKKELKKEEWFKLIEEGTELGVKEWHVCGGGEPLFFKDTIAVMKKIKDFGMYGELITNGTFFQVNVAKEIVEMEWDKIYISLDSPYPKTQNFLRGKKCFDEIIKGVKNLIKWKKRLKIGKPSLFFHSVITNKNYTHIPKLIELAFKLKVDGISLNALNIWKPEIEKLKLKDEEEEIAKKILEKSEEIAKKFHITTNIQDFLNFSFIRKANVMNEAMVKEIGKVRKSFDSIACYYPWYNISIFSNGKALPCFILKDEGENVREKSLKEIWFGSYFNHIRKMFLKNELKNDCSKCNPWNMPKMEEIRRALKKLL
ncbi:MAG: radical SAM protein [Candidatus Aenigmatarchaeota archaeon]